MSNGYILAQRQYPCPTVTNLSQQSYSCPTAVDVYIGHTYPCPKLTSLSNGHILLQSPQPCPTAMTFYPTGLNPSPMIVILSNGHVIVRQYSIPCQEATLKQLLAHDGHPPTHPSPTGTARTTHNGITSTVDSCHTGRLCLPVARFSVFVCQGCQGCRHAQKKRHSQHLESDDMFYRDG